MSYVAAAAEQAGHNIAASVASVDGNNEAEVLAEVGRHRADVVCFSVWQTGYRRTAALAARIREAYPHAKLVAGGPYATLAPERVIADGWDAVCLGEGETAFVEYLGQAHGGAQRPVAVPNMWHRSKDDIVRGRMREWRQDIDAVLPPARAMWDKYIVVPQFARTVVVGRGCAYNCSYCSNHAIRRVAPGQYVRYRNPRGIAQECRQLLVEYPRLRLLYLEGELLNWNLGWLQHLCELLRSVRAASVPEPMYGGNMRPVEGEDYSRVFSWLKEAGFGFINIGLESGSQHIRETVLRRTYSNVCVVNMAHAARRCGIGVRVFVMLGLPGETDADIDATVRVARACEPEWVHAGIFMPYVGTDLHAACAARGLMDSAWQDDGAERCIPRINCAGVPQARIVERYATIRSDIGVSDMSWCFEEALDGYLMEDPQWCQIVT